MLDFIIVGLPRSGTTWLANWLNTDTVYCAHDPLYKLHYSDWHRENFGVDQNVNQMGVACTGVWRWPEWVNNHPARKIIMQRNISQVEYSMANAGMPKLPVNASEKLALIQGHSILFSDLFTIESLQSISDYLQISFNRKRSLELLNMTVNSDWQKKKRQSTTQPKLIDDLLRLGEIS